MNLDTVLMWNSSDKTVKQVTSASLVGSTVNSTVITGNGSATGFTVTHGLNTTSVIVQVAQNAAPCATIYTDVARNGVNTVCVMFATAPANGCAYKVMVIKLDELK